MFTIKLFAPTRANYERIVAIQKANYPDLPMSVTRTKFGDENRNPQYLFQRLVVESDSSDAQARQLVAVASYAEPSWSYRPGKYHIDIDVDPAWQRQGIGTLIYEHIMDVLANRSPAPTLLTTTTRENLPQSIRFLEKRGFQRVMRTPTSEIDLTTFDPTNYAEVVERVLAGGIEIHTVAALKEEDPDWEQKLYELDWEGTQDEPQPDAPTQMSREEYRKWFLEKPEVLLEGWFVAVDKTTGAYVGMSELQRNLEDAERLNTGFACVARAYRRRGIATALKVKGLEFAKGFGAKRIRTGNEEHNPMLQINLRVGFQPLPAWLAYEKRLGGDA